MAIRNDASAAPVRQEKLPAIRSAAARAAAPRRPRHMAVSTTRSSSQTARLHYFGVWLLLLVLETAMCLGLLGAAALAAADLMAGSFSWRTGAALASFLMAMVSGILVKAPYAGRKDMPLVAWALVPLFGHFFTAVCFWLAINPKMRWGKTILEFNEDGTIRSKS